MKRVGNFGNNYIKQKGNKTFTERERERIIHLLKEIQYDASVTKKTAGYYFFDQRIINHVNEIIERIE